MKIFAIIPYLASTLISYLCPNANNPKYQYIVLEAFVKEIYMPTTNMSISVTMSLVS
jgi:hypothetical protein